MKPGTLAEFASHSEPGRLSIVFPIFTTAEKNHGGRTWKPAAKRRRQARGIVQLLWPRQREVPKPPLVVTISRIAPRMLDTDSLGLSLAGVRDQVAIELGLFNLDSKRRAVAKDGPRNQTIWQYENLRGGPYEYGVRVDVQSLEVQPLHLDSNEWRSINCAVPLTLYRTVIDTFERITRDLRVDPDPYVRNGIALERLVADYNAGRRERG